MKISLIGYGKMGRVVEAAALERGHSILIGLDSSADIFIDFTEPEAVIKTARALAFQGKKIPWVIGTTGWDLKRVLPVIKKGEIPTLYGPNFSIGMAVFIRLAKRGAEMMKQEYSCRGIETHHAEKKDIPSGTAQKLMQEIMGLTFDSVREGEHFGIHELFFESENDHIKLVHQAKDRKGFAKGAVLAAEWMEGKEGIYTFDDYLEDMWNQKSLQLLSPH